MSSSLSLAGSWQTYTNGGRIAVPCRRRLPSPRNRYYVKCRPLFRYAASREDAVGTPKTPLNEASESLSDPSGSVKGFGPRPRPSPSKPQKNTKAVTTTRRPAPSKPVVLPTVDTVAQERENYFILSLTAIGVVIFVEGIALAASGLLPEELDAVIVKYVYPVFTPTVGLFLAGAVAYGVYKVFQGGDKDDGSS